MFQSELTLVLSLLASGSAYLLGAGEGMGRFVDINDEIIFVFIYHKPQLCCLPLQSRACLLVQRLPPPRSVLLGVRLLPAQGETITDHC